ncbi:hypothetical protein [Eggerthella sp. YY7918]|uniref:hypothetical protein n=1 Tax=Eggerthella sp. (strain YY7918) TaxID=502558 RepID=UPI001246515F|nr:hypothetical protein [Eggerthella sp. YY7918]
MDYVNEKFPEVYHVVYWDDLVKRHEYDAVDFAKKNFDLVFTYDKGDAEKFDIEYYPSFYSKLNNIEATRVEQDVLFIGNAKNRYEEIISAYDSLSGQGVNCRFYINGVKNSKQKAREGIIYNETFSYREVLNMVVNSNCILDIAQKNSVGYSLRINEALFYSKKLLSNNPNITEIPQYDARYMKVFSRTAEDYALFAKQHEEVKYRFSLEDLSPVSFINHIESRIGCLV